VKVRVVEFFAGCGGTSLGFAMANKDLVDYRVVGAVEMDPHAAATFEKTLGVPVYVGDVRSLLDPAVFAEVSAPWQGPEPLVLIGCAPCQGFSSHRKKDGRSDARNSLLEDFAQIAVNLSPEVIVMENVPEMLSEKHWAHFEAWRDTLEAAGYTVKVAIHNLADFGVPQDRFRALVIASRNAMFPMPRPTVTDPALATSVREAIGHLPPLEAGGRDPFDAMHMTSRHRKETVDLIKLIPHDGGSRSALPQGVGLKCWDGVDGFRDVYGRLWWDRPAVAITARCRTPSCGRFVHPEQDRGLSVREAALLQGFPDWVQFEGPFDDKFKQIGNAVSPLFAKALAEHIATELIRTDSDVTPVDDHVDPALPLSKSFSSSIASIKRARRRTVTA